MSEPSCHFNHKNFSSGQQCVHCSYQEPGLDEFKKEIKCKLEELLNNFVLYHQSQKANSNTISFHHIYLTEERLAELKQTIWYDYDIPELFDEIIRNLNKI